MTHTSVTNILASTKLELGISDITDYDSWLLLAINEYIREFNCFETYVKREKKLTIDECGWVCLPEDFYSLGILRADCVTEFNGTLVSRVGAWVYVDTNTINGWGWTGGFNNCNVGTYQIIGNKIKLMGNFLNVLNATLCYEAYNTDEYGNFHAPKDFENAVMFRMAHRFMIKPGNGGKYNQAQIQWYDQKATAMFNMVKSKSVIRNFRNQRAQILDWVSALITDKNIINWNG